MVASFSTPPFRGNFHLEFSPEKIPGGNCREMAKADFEIGTED